MPIQRARASQQALSSMKSANKPLPPELLLEIFELATSNAPLTSPDYVPFQRIIPSNQIVGIGTARSLSMVCKDWKYLVSSILYRSLNVQYGAELLPTVLERRTGNNSYGDMVRRLVLPYASTTGSRSTVPYIKILSLCRRVEVLVRPQIFTPGLPSFDFDTTIVELPSLRRLEWWHYAEAERAGGINSLASVLRHSPNLRYLLIAGIPGMRRIWIDPMPIRLASLDTLRLNAVNTLLLHQITHRWALPSLRRVILDTPMLDHHFQMLCDAFGHQFQTVEFGRHVRFLLADNLSACLKACPTFIKLNYHVFFTAVPDPDEGFSHPNIETIRLHSAVNPILLNELPWALLVQHFSFLTGKTLPGLKRIVLHGDWKPILQHPMFVPIQELLKGGSIKIQKYDRV